MGSDCGIPLHAPVLLPQHSRISVGKDWVRGLPVRMWCAQLKGVRQACQPLTGDCCRPCVL